MKTFFYTFFILLIVSACSSSVSLPPVNHPTSKVGNLSGKWINSSNKTKVYFEEELEKVVLSDGCQVVSANYKRYEPAISFSNITKTKSICDSNGIDLAEVLKQTVIIKSVTGNKIGFYNEGNISLLILDKN